MMGDRPHPTIIDEYWRAVRDRDPSRIAALVTDDFVEDWPQSGERIRGADAWGRVVHGHPAYPTVSVRRIVGATDVWACEADFDYGGETGVWRICSIIELSGERIARITQYFGAPFPAADWRNEITEPIGA
jgi:hypothetical protein